MGIGDHQYVALTTFTKDGRRKNCPVWIASVGEHSVGFTTSASSWKVKRIRNTARVELRASNSRGIPIPESEVVTGTAQVVFDEKFQKVQDAIKTKYGFQFFLIVSLEKIKHFFRRSGTSSCGIIIALEATGN